MNEEEAVNKNGNEELFAPISAKDNERLEVQSLCMECGGTGQTSILPTIIPNFGRIVVMAFDCPCCNHSSNEVQSANDIQPLGVEFILNVEIKEDLNRQVCTCCCVLGRAAGTNNRSA